MSPWYRPRGVFRTLRKYHRDLEWKCDDEKLVSTVAAMLGDRDEI